MEIENKIYIAQKIIPIKKNILLDYFSFSPGVDYSFEQVRERWMEFVRGNQVSTHMYLHIPFCSSICHYCMYHTIPIRKADEVENYVREVQEYLSAFVEVFQWFVFSGLYVGGWTPSLLSVHQMQRLFGESLSSFCFHPDYYRTIELNPVSTNFEKLDLLRSVGFTRISFGVQSFRKDTLRNEGRRYVSPERINELVWYANRLWFHDVNADLIVWLGGDEREDLYRHLTLLRASAPSSITLYTILKDMERSALYNVDRTVFYARVAEMVQWAIRHSGISCEYEQNEWSHVLWCTLTRKNKDRKKGYEAHGQTPSSIFGVGYRAYSRIWWVGHYEWGSSPLGASSLRFSTSSSEDEMYAYVLRAFQYCINLSEFQAIFWENFLQRFEKELAYLLQEGVVDISDSDIRYTWHRDLIGWYGLLFLDTGRLIRFVKNRFYETR